MGSMSAEAALDTELAAPQPELTEVEAEPAAETAAAEVAPEVSTAAPEVLTAEGEVPALETEADTATELSEPAKAAQTEQAQTASDAAFQGDMTPHERDHLVEIVKARMTNAVDPFLLACSNLRVDLRAAAAGNPGLIALLGKIAFGDMLPGITHAKPDAGPGFSDAAGKLVGSAAQNPLRIVKMVDHVGKLPMMNFNLNYPGLVSSESDDQFLDDLTIHVGEASEAMRGGLHEHSNDELAALAVAFDGRTNSTMHYEDQIQLALTKLEGGDEVAAEAEDDIEAVQTVRELAYVGDPGDADKRLAVVETETKAGTSKHQVIEMVPDEMKELALAKHGKEPGTLHQDKMHPGR